MSDLEANETLDSDVSESTEYEYDPDPIAPERVWLDNQLNHLQVPFTQRLELMDIAPRVREFIESHDGALPIATSLLARHARLAAPALNHRHNRLRRVAFEMFEAARDPLNIAPDASIDLGRRSERAAHEALSHFRYLRSQFPVFFDPYINNITTGG